MESQDLIGILVNVILFFLAFKLGQINMIVKMGQQNRTQNQQQLEQVRITGKRPLITVEEINGIFYAYDGNDFLAQGKSAAEVGHLIAERFPGKYKLAEVKIKA